MSNPWPIGLYLDVFPLDKVPSADLKGNKIISKMNFHSLLLNSTIWKARGNEPLCIRMLFSIGTLIPKLFSGVIRRKCSRRIDELAKTWEKDDCEQFMCDLEWTTGLTKIVYRTTDLFPAVYLSFNGRSFKIPHNYKELLVQWYGDYMKLPPERDRVPHIAEAYFS